MNVTKPTKRKKFFEMFTGHETARRCSRCPSPAVAWLYTADETGSKDKSSRQPVCRECLAKERKNL